MISLILILSTYFIVSLLIIFSKRLSNFIYLSEGKVDKNSFYSILVKKLIVVFILMNFHNHTTLNCTTIVLNYYKVNKHPSRPDVNLVGKGRKNKRQHWAKG